MTLLYRNMTRFKALALSGVLGLLAVLGIPLFGQAPAPVAPLAKGQAQEAQKPSALSADGKVWVAQKGDSLYSISQKTGISFDKLKAANPKLAKRDLWVGDKVSLDVSGVTLAKHEKDPAKPVEPSAPGLTEAPVPEEKPQAKAEGPSPVSSPAPNPTKAASAPEGQSLAKAVATTKAAPATKLEEARPEPVRPPEPPTPPAPKKMRQEAPREVKGFRSAPDDLVVVRELRDVKEITYNPDAVPLVNCGPTIVTSIYLPDKEKIAGSTCGDSENWLLTPIEGRNAFYLKPKAVGVAYETNLVIICESGNVYNIALTADPAARPLKTLRFLPPANALFPGDAQDETGIIFEPGQKVQGGNNGGLVGLSGVPGAGGRGRGGLSPADVQALLEQRSADERSRAERQQKEFMAAMMDKRQDDFNISYDWNCPFRVKTVFAASGVTYFKVDVPDNAQPLFWVIDNNGSKAAVNMVPLAEIPGAFMVDRIFLDGRIVVGNKEARIHNAALARQMKAMKNAR